jgi:uncharacterized protein YndB with AHSA1/START domain
MMFRASLAAVAALAVPASAEVVGASGNGFEVRHVVTIVVPQEAAYDAFARLPEWWNAEHSYSGKSSNMSLSLSAGGCFCERLENGGGVEHMRVAYVEPGQRIVMTGPLGPLLYEATAGVMDVQVERTAGGSRVTLDYKVAGFANGGADKLAPIVDRVLGDQMARYRKFAAAIPKTR